MEKHRLEKRVVGGKLWYFEDEKWREMKGKSLFKSEYGLWVLSRGGKSCKLVPNGHILFDE